MNTTARLLDSYKAAMGFTTDTQAADSLGIARATASLWRVGKTAPRIALLVKMANACKLDPIPIALEIEAERTSCPEASKTWRKLAAAAVAGLAAGGATAAAILPSLM